MKNYDTNINAQISWVYTRDLDSTAEFYGGVPGLQCCREQADAMIFKTGNGASIGLCRAFADRVVEPKEGMISILLDQ